MRQKNEKKLLSFVNFSLIDKFLKDVSIHEGTTESQIAEEILLGFRPPLLPHNQAASAIIKNLYTADDAVSTMYRSAFGQISALIGGGYIPQKERILIDSLHSALCRSQATYQGQDKPALDWYIKQLSAFLVELEQIYAKMPDQDLAVYGERHKLQGEIKFGYDLIDELESEPEYTMYHNIINIILNTWQYVNTSTTTYRLLVSQMALINLPNTPENRLFAAAYIKEASSDWPDYPPSTL